MSPILPVTGLLLAAAMVAGCATTAAEPEVAGAAKPEVCEREYRVGSNIPTRECRAVMSEAERRHVVDEVNQVIRPSVAKNPGG